MRTNNSMSKSINNHCFRTTTYWYISLSNPSTRHSAELASIPVFYSAVRLYRLKIMAKYSKNYETHQNTKKKKTASA